MKTTPFWTDQTPRPADLPVGELPEQTDLAVIGSGYTGLNAAIEVGKAGGDVTVIEQETVGWGASSRNGGMLTPGLKPSASYLQKQFGLEMAKALWEWSVDACKHIARLVEEEKIDCDYDQRGHAYLAHKPSHVEGMLAYKKTLEDDYGYHGSFWVPQEEIENEIGSTAFYGGLSDEMSAGLDPAKYVYGLGYTAAKYGAKLVEMTRVTKITRDNGNFILSTTRGQVKAKEVLAATNGYTTNLTPRIRQGVIPIGSYIIVTEPLPEAVQKEISPKGRQFYDSKYFLNYFRLTADGRALMGGRNNLSTGLDLVRSAGLLKKRMWEIWPQLEGYEITHSWTGKLGVSLDMLPHVGRLNGVWFGNGYSGHGLSIGSYLGYEIGQILAGKRQSSPFLEINHPRFLFASLDKLYLPFVAQWYRLKDWLK
jgi:glycine/D-amino acid oxidase-like deaminating enzyme